MKCEKLKVSVLALGLLMVSGYVSAQSNERGGKGGKMPTASELIAEMDADEDGQLSEDEVKGPLKDNFAKIDADEDGYLTEEELENAKPKGRPQRN